MMLCFLQDTYSRKTSKLKNMRTTSRDKMSMETKRTNYEQF